MPFSKKSHIALLIGMLLSAASAATPEKQILNGISYRLLKTKPEAVSILWANAAGEALRTFPAALQFLRASDPQALTMMNGGIFEPDGIPSGLLIQDGKELHPVNRKAGEGNFYLQPNGIFLISEQGAAIIATSEYPPKATAIRCAVQSGPLLLRHGKTHPAFNAASASRLMRNGVGVDQNGQVIFAITDSDSPKFPNLHEFAELFRQLGCKDALFLDGVISQMRSGNDLLRRSNRFGSLIIIRHP